MKLTTDTDGRTILKFNRKLLDGEILFEHPEFVKLIKNTRKILKNVIVIYILHVEDKKNEIHTFAFHDKKFASRAAKAFIAEGYNVGFNAEITGE